MNTFFDSLALLAEIASKLITDINVPDFFKLIKTDISDTKFLGSLERDLTGVLGRSASLKSLSSALQHDLGITDFKHFTPKSMTSKRLYNTFKNISKAEAEEFEAVEHPITTEQKENSAAVRSNIRQERSGKHRPIKLSRETVSNNLYNTEKRLEKAPDDLASGLLALERLIDMFIHIYAPVDTGNMLNSRYIKTKGTTVEIGIDCRKAPYAPKVEIMPYNHPRGGRSHFMEAAAVHGLQAYNKSCEQLGHNKIPFNVSLDIDTNEASPRLAIIINGKNNNISKNIKDTYPAEDVIMTGNKYYADRQDFLKTHKEDFWQYMSEYSLQQEYKTGRKSAYISNRNARIIYSNAHDATKLWSNRKVKSMLKKQTIIPEQILSNISSSSEYNPIRYMTAYNIEFSKGVANITAAPKLPKLFESFYGGKQ